MTVFDFLSVILIFLTLLYVFLLWSIDTIPIEFTIIIFNSNSQQHCPLGGASFMEQVVVETDDQHRQTIQQQPQQVHQVRFTSLLM